MDLWSKETVGMVGLRNAITVTQSTSFSIRSPCQTLDDERMFFNRRIRHPRRQTLGEASTA